MPDEEEKKTTAAKLLSEAVAFANAQKSKAQVPLDAAKKSVKNDDKENIEPEPQNNDEKRETQKSGLGTTCYIPYDDLNDFDNQLGEKIVNPINKTISDKMIKDPTQFAINRAKLNGSLESLDIKKDEFANKDLKTRTELIDKKFDAQIAKLDALMPKKEARTDAQQKDYDAQVKKLGAAQECATKYAKDIDGIHSTFNTMKQKPAAAMTAIASKASAAVGVVADQLNNVASKVSNKAVTEPNKQKNTIITPTTR
ncbi:MAG: hypothetical protein WC627_09910 [Legionella sp.]|jgi:hypothetical protein